VDTRKGNTSNQWETGTMNHESAKVPMFSRAKNINERAKSGNWKVALRT
jgi:hypothetical protein